MPKVKKINKITERIETSIRKGVLLPCYDRGCLTILLVSKKARRIYYRLPAENYPIRLDDYLVQRTTALPPNPMKR